MKCLLIYCINHLIKWLWKGLTESTFFNVADKLFHTIGHEYNYHTISYCFFKSFNEQTFTSDLQDAPSDLFKVFDDTNDVVDTWSHVFLFIADTHLPLKSHRVKYKQQPKWMSQDITDALKTRDRYKSLNNDNQYKTWCNRVASLI